MARSTRQVLVDDPQAWHPSQCYPWATKQPDKRQGTRARAQGPQDPDGSLFGVNLDRIPLSTGHSRRGSIGFQNVSSLLRGVRSLQRAGKWGGFSGKVRSFRPATGNLSHAQSLRHVGHSSA